MGTIGMVQDQAKRIAQFLCCLLWITGGCTMAGPDYQPVENLLVDDTWQAALPHGGSDQGLAQWWSRFQDPVLSDLIHAALVSHPRLERALAAIEEARATLGQRQGEESGQVNTQVVANRSGDAPNSGGATLLSRNLILDASWEVDLFGRLGRATEAAQARIASRQADWANARISLAAEVGLAYVDWRACQLLTQSLATEVHSREETERATQVAVQAGLRTPGEGALAAAGLAEVRSQWRAQTATCQVTLKALVALTGLEEEVLVRRLAGGAPQLPQHAPFQVTPLPLQLLSQRPDLARAEREVAAASADIGVAEASRYPRLSLLGNVGLQVVTNHEQSMSFQPWSFGPGLALPLLDGGRGEAGVRAATARYRMAVADYRQVVRQAVVEVEQALVNLAGSQARSRDARLAAEGYEAFFRASQVHWRAGGLSLLTLEEARRAATNAERQRLQLARDEVRQWMALYKALGGGWESMAGETP